MFPAAIATIPPGALDLTGEAVRRRRVLQRAAMGALEYAGYEELIPPTFEYEDTFLRAAGAAVAERLVRFPDRDGRILALRYDFTASLARIAATTFSGAKRPLRLSYSGKVYRQEPERGGRPREMLQVGAELLGQGDLTADIEIVRLTLSLLTAAGLRDFQVNLGHVGVLAAGLGMIEEPLRSDVRRWIDRKDRGSLRRALANLSGDACTLTTLPFVIGRRDALEEAARTAPEASRPGLEHLLALDAALTSGERAHLVYDLGEVRGLDYYTGIHFELYVAGAGRAAGAGGRYDELMGRFGHPMPAVGVSLDLDTIAEVVV
jgi:ATP phosphoribosyltransferase regulatory subunit